ncbi:MAG: iduronate-2-sulfatase [Saprospiraceae bacterium]|nr:MAG: iduronate-2-sulfatase [Saprospiraceae bacterium]
MKITTFPLLLFCCLLFATSAAAQESQQKNILFIAVDDLKPLLASYGNEQMHTPNFDRLAKMGVSFHNAHVQQAVCGPSRASIMTGMYPDHTKVWDLHTDFRESAPKLKSMPEYLITQGYETTGIGKIYHKGSSAPGHDGKSWSIPHIIPDNFDTKYGEPAFSYYQNEDTKAKMEALVKEAKTKGIKGNGKQRNYVFDQLKPSTESADVPDEAYQDGLYTIAAIEKLQQLKETGKPFFLAVGYQKPHLPFVAPQKYWDLYKREDIDLAAFQETAEGTPKIAYHSFGELKAYSDIDKSTNVGDRLPEAKQRELVHGYMACVSYIDAQIGKLLDALEAEKLMDNTVIVMWGDHGFHLGDHTLWCKHSNFEQATRIPLIFAGPGIAKDVVVAEQPVELVDVFPTLFELAGVKDPGYLDGKSLVPLLDNDDKTIIDRDYAISQYPRRKSIMGYSIRTDRYRYTEWHDNNYRSDKTYKEENIIGVELYDYQEDPNETRNYATDKTYREVATLLKKKLQAHLNQQLKNKH